MIGPSAELVTPGHDGQPLALVLTNWTAGKRLWRYGFRTRGKDPMAISGFPPADRFHQARNEQNMRWLIEGGTRPMVDAMPSASVGNPTDFEAD
jgi:hypothetical protein